MERFLRLSLLLAILSVISCTRKGAKDATLKFQLPGATKLASKAMTNQAKITSLSEQHWGSTDPGLLSDINCYAVLINHAPQDAVNTCTGAGVPAFNISQAAGLYPAGSTVELDIPSGPAQTFYLLGLKATDPTECSAALDRYLNLSHFSHPVLIAKTTADIAPGVNEISMTASMIGAAPLASCIGPTASFGETAPLAFITSPPDGSFISASSTTTFTLSGTCSEEGQLVTIEGPVTSTATCSNQSWTAQLDLTPLIDGSISFGVSQTSPSAVKGPVASRQFIKDATAPAVAFTSPNSGALVDLLHVNNFIVSGICSENGRSITLTSTGLTLPTVICNSGQWTAGLNLSALSLGPATITAQISDSAGNVTSSSLSLNRSNTSGAHLTLSDGPTYYFNMVAPGSATHIFTLTNDGDIDATGISAGTLPTNISFAGGVFPGTSSGGTCGNTLGAGDSCNIAVQFDASAATTSSGSLDILYDTGKSVSVALQAAAVTPAVLVISPTPYNFNSVQIGTSHSNTFTLTNTGHAQATNLSFNPISAPFSITNKQCGTSLAPNGGHCTFQVNFAPTTTGVSSFIEYLSYNDGQTTQAISVSLAGTGANTHIVLADTFTISQNSKTGFKVSVTYSGDDNYNATVRAYYCNETVSPDCNPLSGGNFALTRGVNLFSGMLSSLSGSYHAFDKVRVKIQANDDDGWMPATVQQETTLATKFTKIAAGDAHTCAIRKEDQQILCWGDNTNGQLGQSGAPTTPSTVGLMVTNPVAGQNWISIDAGGNTTCAIDTNQDGYCWGYGVDGELGNNTITSRDTPAPISGGHKWSKISVGENHACGLATDGHVYCWGNNTYGQLGDVTNTNSSAPVEVDSSHTYIDVSAGGTSSCGVRSDHYGMCWGQNNLGQLGDNTFVDNNHPVYVSGSSRFLKIVVGRSHVEGVNDDTNVLYQFMYGWGDSAKKELGVSSDYAGYTSFGVPTALNPAYGQWSRIALGNQFSCGIRTVYPSEVPGRVSCWGDNSYDQMGSSASGSSYVSNPITVIDQDQVEIAAGSHYVCTVDNTGYLHCWGDNTKGQLGDGATTQINTPKLVSP